MAVETPIGFIPNVDDINLEDLNFEKQKLKDLLYFDKQGWVKEMEEVKKFFEKFGERFPKRLWNEFYDMQKRIQDYKNDE